MEAATETGAAVDVLLDTLATGDFDHLRTVVRPDCFFDATVPGWRFQLRGADAIVEQLRHWWPTPARLPEHRVTATPAGAVVEFERRWEEDGDLAGCRQVHVLTLDGGRVTEMRVTCAGRWDEETLNEIDAQPGLARC